ncbi:hypothetical protein Mterra_00474 [Calidithermus terrae]|uniref:Outer membrane lipoprotein-sorting protein n=1 Tax=Calidithermus terrae TaxID=1408545 RepID=A0A399F424_9DEIN|nr:hypothetical protein [Calidithermus terrae]RIH90406.1 hypothetical protein Mterra_00474 [Calidithermus terrae]
MKRLLPLALALVALLGLAQDNVNKDPAYWLELGLKANGGDALRNLKTLSYTLEYKPPFTDKTNVIKVYLDFVNLRSRLEIDGAVRVNSKERSFTKRGEQVQEGIYSTQPGNFMWDILFNEWPGLRFGKERDEASYVMNVTYKGKRYHQVLTKTKGVSQGFMFFDDGTVAGYFTPKQSTITFDKTEVVGGITVPVKATEFREGFPYADLVYKDYQINPALSPDLFSKP